jgi:hypothetical protein
MTRAKHQLEIVVPQRFYVHQQSRGGDRHLYALRTRFLPDTLLGLFEQRMWPIRAAEPGRAVAGMPEARVGATAGAVAVRLRRRFVGINIFFRRLWRKRRSSVPNVI